VTLRLIDSISLSSCLQRSFARRGYSVRLHLRSYNLIRQSVRILSTSDFNPYTKGLWHSRIVPAYLTDLPQFTLRLFLCMPSSLPRRAVLLLLSVSSQNASVFAQNVQARHPHLCPRHFPSRFRAKDTLSHEAAMFALCYGLQSCSPHRNGLLHFREGLGTFTSEPSLIRSPS
jgi:hypothetical protein